MTLPSAAGPVAQAGDRKLPRLALSGQGLACERGGRLVFSALDVRVVGGDLVLLRGPNGVGKSSLLRLIAGLLPLRAGQLTLEHGDPERTIGEQAHYVGHLDALKPALTVEENLGFWRRMLGAGDSVASALEAVGLAPLAAFPAAILSAGQRRRLALARLLVAPRPLWLLDEPTTALDTEGQQRLASLIRRHRERGGMALVATHLDLAGATASITLGRPA